MLRRRPLARAAMVGGTAYVAGRAGARRGAASAQAQQAPAPEYTEAPPEAEPAPSSEDAMAELTQLKQLLDSGTLTQAEFDAQKQKILQRM